MSSRLEDELFRRINRARLLRGRRALTRGATLDRLARSHSVDMEMTENLFHTSNLVKLVPPGTITSGENVGAGVGVKELHRAFMASTDHRRNILDPLFTTGGVGIVSVTDDRGYVTLWATEVFCG